MFVDSDSRSMVPFKFPKLQIHMIHFTMCRPRYLCMVPFAMVVSVIANKLFASKSRRVRNITNAYVVHLRGWTIAYIHT